MLISAQNMSDANELVIGLHLVKNEHARDLLTIFLDKAWFGHLLETEKEKEKRNQWSHDSTHDGSWLPGGMRLSSLSSPNVKLIWFKPFSAVKGSPCLRCTS